MKNFKIKSYCKINLNLRIIGKLNNGFHRIVSLVTFCDLFDEMLVSTIKNSRDNITFSGRFKKGIDKKKNTITDVLKILRNEKLLKKQNFKINIKKNIPHGAGLGGGSSNASNLLYYLNSKIKLNLSKNKLRKMAKKIGSDAPIFLENKNTFLTGKNDEMLRLNNKFKLNLLIVYPSVICSTKKIYKKNKIKSLVEIKKFFDIKNRLQLIGFLKTEKNDLEQTVTRIYPRVKRIIKLIKSQKGCYFSRITGSGSACIGIFHSMNHAIYAKKMIRLKNPKYWCVVSKTI